jgi:endonuclease YncB( thermonuclease family)
MLYAGLWAGLAGISLALFQGGLVDRISFSPGAIHGERLYGNYTFHGHLLPCTQASHRTCVVDGDTIRINDVKIRVSDINTPETHDYGCEREASLGRSATQRLVSLLNEGPFQIVSRDSEDVDRYGRKLRTLERDGRSIGQQLVDEGLAHQWRGYRQNWCS